MSVAVHPDDGAAFVQKRNEQSGPSRIQEKYSAFVQAMQGKGTSGSHLPAMQAYVSEGVKTPFASCKKKRKTKIKPI